MSGNRRDEIVSLAVYPETKKEWEEAVDEDPDAGSLSQLIRVAVNRYLANQSNEPGRVGDELTEHLSELTTRQQQVMQRQEEIKGQVTNLRETFSSTEIDPETQEVAKDIFEQLPTHRDVQTEPVMPGASDDDVPAPQSGSIEWLCDRLEASRYQIQAALDHLQETTYAVGQTDDGRYYKEV